MTAPLPPAAVDTIVEAGRHGWRVDHTVHRVLRSIVEHQVTFTRGPDSVVTFWCATVDGDDIGGHDFSLYRDLELVERRHGDRRQLAAWLAATRGTLEVVS